MQLVIVSNIIAGGAFDDAVKGSSSPSYITISTRFDITLFRPFLNFERHVTSEPLIYIFCDCVFRLKKSSALASLAVSYPIVNLSNFISW